MLEKLPKKFGNEEEISIIEQVNDPSLTSDDQLLDKKKGLPKKLESFLRDLLITYEELGMTLRQ